MNKLIKYSSLLYRQKDFFRFKPIYFAQKHYFCTSIKIEKPNINNDIEEKIIISPMYFTKLTKNIYKFLSASSDLYNKLGEDSIKLSYDVSSDPSKDYLKEELLRLNKQLHYLQRELSFFEDMTKIINDIIFNEELIKEGEISSDTQLVKTSKNDIKKLSKEINELEKEIVEYLIPEEDVNNI